MSFSNQQFRIALLVACVSAVAPAINAATPASDADKTFVGKVSQGGMYEVEASKIAEKQSTTQDVSDVASAEVHDHELVNAKLKNIASAHSINVATKLNAEFQQRLYKLKAVSGSAFDAAYIADMQQIHDKDEKLFAAEATGGSADFRSFAHETDLVVKRHIGALHGTEN